VLGFLQGDYNDRAHGPTFLKVLCKDGGIHNEQLVKDVLTKLVPDQWLNNSSYDLGDVFCAARTVENNITI